MHNQKSSSHIPVPGEPAPWFKARSTSNAHYHFDTVAGRYVVLCFFASAGDALGRGVLERVLSNRRIFDDEHASFFGVSMDPEDEKTGRVAESLPGIRHFWDFDGRISHLYGRLAEGRQYSRISVVLDERLRVYAVVPFTDDPAWHVRKLLEIVAGAPRISANHEAAVPAPVLILPRVFSLDLCRRLIAYYNEGGATESGFMREIGGRTVGIHDRVHKRRTDKNIDDEALKKECVGRISACVVPEIRKAFQFHANRIERHIVGCYDGERKGHFRSHRDNTTKGTAHRRFAVSVVLNSNEFEGGQLRFPEFGRQTYNPPPGGAVIFSCSLLHEATPVTKGCRFVYLPFLYDDAAAQIRQKNTAFIGEAEERKEEEGKQSGTG